jgi:Alr-MurF fusion protein
MKDIRLHFKDLPAITQGEIIQQNANPAICQLITDSRKVIVAEDSIFFSIIGDHHDGHHYLQELYNKGIRQFIVEKDMEIFYQMPEANILKVSNSIQALQKIAAWHRGNYDYPVIAITGSNGKTIVKEWLSQLLSAQLNVVKSPKSYNSQIGVPISLWQMNRSHEIAIIEAGISKPGEMEKLQLTIQPDIGIFTNIGTAHDEGFESRVQKIEEKAILFKSCKVIIYCKDHEGIDKVLTTQNGKAKLFTWSKNAHSDVKILSIKKEPKSTEINLLLPKQSLFLTLPFTDDASIENCMHCITYMLYEQFSPGDIQKGINSLGGVGMRLELKQGINDCYLIDDTYNNDLAGLQIALDFMNQQKQKEKKTIILSDILEAGMGEKNLYRTVGNLLYNKGINRVIGIGPQISANKNMLHLHEMEFYEDVEQFFKHFKTSSLQKELILIKGARVFRFEKIVSRLQQKIHGTVLEINLDALTNNLNFYRSKLKHGTKLMVMVKALAYGSGSYEIAHLLQFHRVDYLTVAYTDEGVALRENGITVPIMVMNPSPESFEHLLEYNLEPEIYSIRILHSFLDFLDRNGGNTKIHLKLDTGMHRLGFEEENLEELIGLLQKASHQVKVVSIFSHLAGADESRHNEYSKKQAESFLKFSERIEKGIGNKVLKHLVNSAGIIRFPKYHFDMVRLGIGLYGIEASNLEPGSLQNISTLKATISQIKHIKKGHTIGYSRKGLAEHDLKIATITIGYADGFDRGFSNGVASVWVNGKLAPVIGNVCMDMTMINITGIDAEEGDEVIIFGNEIPITDLAAKISTIPYEILTNISERVKRVFYTE